MNQVAPDPPSATSIRLGRFPCLYGSCPVCPAYSHCYPCQMEDGTPYRMAVRKDGVREIHDGDTDRLIARLQARQEPLGDALVLADHICHVPRGYAAEPNVEAAPPKPIAAPPIQHEPRQLALDLSA